MTLVNPPNILMIMTDQQRYDSLSCYGCEAVRTPHLDKLAEEGALFRHCYANGTVCTPSRASIMTGKHVVSHGVRSQRDILSEDEVMFPRYLKNRGYQTALFGKFNVSATAWEVRQEHPHHGFDLYEWCHAPDSHLDSPMNAYGRWLKEKDERFYNQYLYHRSRVAAIPEHLHMSRWAAERAAAYIRNEADPEKPFFCMVSVFDPHNPYFDTPQGWEGKVNRKGFKPLIPPGGERSPGDDRYLVEQMRRGNALPDAADASDVDRIRAGYFASIAFFDEQVRLVLDALEARGIAKDTMVIFLSDHGDMLGDHGLFVKGAFFYEACARVPLLIRYPRRIPGGLQVDHLVQPHDLAATLLYAAGYSEKELEGLLPESANLFRAMDGSPMADAETAICTYHQSGTAYQEQMFERYRELLADQRLWPGSEDSPYTRAPLHCSMIRKGRYKLTLYHGDSFPRNMLVPLDLLPAELYDMKLDPDEIHNLRTDPAYVHVVSALISELAEHWQKTGE